MNMRLKSSSDEYVTPCEFHSANFDSNLPKKVSTFFISNVSTFLVVLSPNITSHDTLLVSCEIFFRNEF